MASSHPPEQARLAGHAGGSHIHRLTHSAEAWSRLADDGRFDQLDIVEVMTASKYLTGERASWNEGDWNGDNHLDQRDVISAQQTGRYLQGWNINTLIGAPLDSEIGGRTPELQCELNELDAVDEMFAVLSDG